MQCIYVYYVCVDRYVLVAALCSAYGVAAVQLAVQCKLMRLQMQYSRL
jgi:hypothetical protein